MKGFLDHWLICGPFFSDRGWATLDEDYLFGEARVRPKKGAATFGHTWIEFDTADHFLQFLFAPFAHTLFVTGYAHTYVRAPADMDAVLLTGSDDGIKVWLNGRVVLRNDVNRAAVPGDDKADIHLNAGWNSLLVKVRQGMSHWQFCAQLLDSDGREIPGLESAREADCPYSAAPARQVGVRVRFDVETYDFSDGAFRRDVQFEVGATGSEKCDGVALRIGGVRDVPVGDIKPGETRIVRATLPFESIPAVMQGKVAATSGGGAVETVVTLSDHSRLLRDLFAPFLVPDSVSAEIPAVLRGFGWSEFARDDRGCYMLIDPPGLRRYLAGLVGRFPMNDADAVAAAQTCAELLRLALDHQSDEFGRILASAKLPELEASK